MAELSNLASFVQKRGKLDLNKLAKYPIENVVMRQTSSDAGVFIVDFGAGEPVIMKITSRRVPSKGVIDNIRNEVEILYTLGKTIVDTRITPCITRIYDVATFRSVKTALDAPINCSSYFHENAPREGIGGIKNVLCHIENSAKLHNSRGVLISFLEHCGTGLFSQLSYLLESKIIYTGFMIRNLLFQLFHTMAAIRHVYPHFIHGDLHLDNVMVKSEKMDSNEQHHLEITANGHTYYVPFYGLLVKIIDFGRSSLDIGTTHSLDMWLLIYTLNKLMSKFANMHTPSVELVRTIISALDPKNTRALEEEYMIVHGREYTFPTFEDALELDVFKIYSEPPDSSTLYMKYGY